GQNLSVKIRNVRHGTADKEELPSCCNVVACKLFGPHKLVIEAPGESAAHQQAVRRFFLACEAERGTTPIISLIIDRFGQCPSAVREVRAGRVAWPGIGC